MAAADASLSSPPARRAWPSGTRFVPLGFGLLAATYGGAHHPAAARGARLDGAGRGPRRPLVGDLRARCARGVRADDGLLADRRRHQRDLRDDARLGARARRFLGKRFVNAIIDLPFALPTIVAGLTLIALYGQRSPVGINIAYTRTAIVVALAFVTLPFVVRSVQPVLRELDREAEQAATSLGAIELRDVPSRDPAGPRARHRERLQPGVRQGGRRVRLDRPDQRQHPAQDRGRLGRDLRPPREQRRARARPRWPCCCSRSRSACSC